LDGSTDRGLLRGPPGKATRDPLRLEARTTVCLSAYMPDGVSALLRNLLAAARAAGGPELLFSEEIEWTGELPFGNVATLRCGGREVPFAWDSFDLRALAERGWIEEARREVLSADGQDARITWRITGKGLAAAAADRGGGAGP
jgi:hypothetical protein